MYFRRAFERLRPAELRELKVTTTGPLSDHFFLIELPLLDLHVDLDLYIYSRNALLR